MRRTAIEMFSKVEAFNQYVGTKKSFCHQHQINPHTLDYWRIKYRKNQAKETENERDFIEITPNIGSLKQTGSYIVHFMAGHQLELPAETPPSILMALIKQLS